MNSLPELAQPFAASLEGDDGLAGIIERGLNRGYNLRPQIRPVQPRRSRARLRPSTFNVESSTLNVPIRPPR